MKQIKCVVFDLDNTIWEGIVSQDKEVKLKKNIIRIIEKLDENGVLLSIASKNEAKSTLKILKKYKIDSYFVFPQINYEKKCLSILEISKKTGISIKHMAFVDDDFYELLEMKSNIPEILVMNVSEFERKSDEGVFDSEFVTNETKNRRKYFLSEMHRLKDLERYAISDKKEMFDLSLEMEFLYRKRELSDDERISELQRRTNKFNNRGRLDQNDYILVFEYKDRYFDHGVVGVFGIRMQGKVLCFDNVCISCRMFARDIVDLVLKGIINHYAEKYDISSIQIDMKNNMDNLYFVTTLRSLGFFKKNEQMYELNIGAMFEIPEYIKMRVEA